MAWASNLPADHILIDCSNLGVSGRLVGPAAFKAVEASFARRLVGSIPIHSRLKTTCFADSMPL